MEHSEISNTTFQKSEVRIKDQAVLTAYSATEKMNLDLEVQPMELFLFCIQRGQVIVQASFIPHPLELKGQDAIFLANPRGPWELKIMGAPGSEFYVTRMELGTLHQMISPSFDTNTLQQEPKIKVQDLMRLIPVNPAIIMCFEQLFHHKINPPFQVLFEQAKFLEIFSLLMESAFGQPVDVCPVAMSPSIEQKLSQVRRHIIENVEDVPDPEQLALLYELPRNTLKEGYKFKYGKTIHQFHADHKLESAMQMLASGELLVKEIAFKIGYQNPSHFISAFKKKFGYTPKQFVRKEG